MKKRKKILSLIAISILICIPYSTYAEPESTITPTPTVTPSPSPTEEPEVPIKKSIDIEQEEIKLDTEKVETLKVTVVPNDAEIEWSSSNEKIVTVKDGKITAGNIAGEAVITATIKGTEIKDTCTVKVLRAVGKDATLKKLVISNGKLDKDFDPEILEYSVTIDSNITKLTFDYELSDENATFLGPDNNTNLKNGDQLKFKVVAENKENKIYTLTIIKDATSLELKSLKINGYALNESFKEERLDYTASIPYEVDTITIVATVKDNAATVKTDGLNNLKVGENKVTITISDKNGNTKKYTIIVTRESKATIPENPTSIITSSDHGTTSNNVDTSFSKNNSSSDDLLKYAIVSIACLLLFVIGGIGIYFYLKTSPKKLKKQAQTFVQKKEKEASPILEVPENEKDNLEQTKEYNVEKERKIQTLEDLFNDEEDV